MAFSHFYLNPPPCFFSISPVWGGSESEIYGTIRASRLLKQMFMVCTREVSHADLVAKIQAAEWADAQNDHNTREVAHADLVANIQTAIAVR